MFEVGAHRQQGWRSEQETLQSPCRALGHRGHHHSGSTALRSPALAGLPTDPRCHSPQASRLVFPAGLLGGPAASVGEGRSGERAQRGSRAEARPGESKDQKRGEQWRAGQLQGQRSGSGTPRLLRQRRTWWEDGGETGPRLGLARSGEAGTAGPTLRDERSHPGRSEHRNPQPKAGLGGESRHGLGLSLP